MGYCELKRFCHAGQDIAVLMAGACRMLGEKAEPALGVCIHERAANNQWLGVFLLSEQQHSLSVFADRYNVQSLKALTLHKLHRDLLAYRIVLFSHLSLS